MFTTSTTSNQVNFGKKRRLTEIYNKMRKHKKQQKPRKGHVLRPYDADGKGDARFESAYELMFNEGYNTDKASLKIIGKS